jgi:hypothetical protein
MSLPVGRLTLLAILLSVLSGGCTYDLTRFILGSASPPTHVPELDDTIINLEGIQRASSQEDVRAVLGEPPFVHELYGDGKLQWTSWWYPMRSIDTVSLSPGARAQRQVIPAAILKIWLDRSGRVDKWGFFHPITKSFMEIRESIEQIDLWFGKIRNPPKRIELAVLLRRGTLKEDVLKGMRWFEGLISKELERSQVHISREGQQEILIYYADHPSPLYVPPNYVVVTFYPKGDLGTSWHFEGWGGYK